MDGDVGPAPMERRAGLRAAGLEGDWRKREDGGRVAGREKARCGRREGERGRGEVR